MKRTVFSVLLALFASSFSVGSAHAGGAPAMAHYAYKGKYVSASFYSQNDCIFTSVYVGAGESVTRQGGRPSASRMVSVYVGVYNACDDTYEAAMGDASLAASEFMTDQGKTLNSATVRKTLDICHYDIDWNPGDCEPITLDLTWTGTGVAYRGMSHGHWFGPGTKFVSHDNSTYRDAAIAGSVTDGWGNDYASLDGFYASMSYSNGGWVDIYK